MKIKVEEYLLQDGSSPYQSWFDSEYKARKKAKTAANKIAKGKR